MKKQWPSIIAAILSVMAALLLCLTWGVGLGTHGAAVAAPQEAAPTALPLANSPPIPPGDAKPRDAASTDSPASMGWVVECVDCPKYIAVMTDRSLRLDAAGHPHVAYGGDHLYYAWQDGTTWHLETVDDAPGVGAYASLALDGGGYPHISYFNDDNDDLKYAYRDAAGCTAELQALGGLFQPGRSYDPAVAQATIASAERSLATDSQDEPVDLGWHRLATASPLARAGHAMAYDSARGVTVLFGGNIGNDYLNDTWEWDGMDWDQRFPAHSPTARNGHGLAYDSARGVTVLFGGYDGSSRLHDTWEWDGTDWTLRSPADKPTSRSFHAMAYDSARGVTVLFGGYDGNDYLNDTWEWDGTNWTLRSPANKPTARTNYAMVYDSAREETVLFGGYDGNYRGDTWEWDGTNWTQRFPAHSPAARAGPAMAYDSARGVTVLFGGHSSDAYYVYPVETSEWDGTDWTNYVRVDRPTARAGHDMVYDSRRGVTVLFGGSHIGYYFDDTWEWDGTCWTDPFFANKPRGRVSHRLAYDSARGVTVLFGGYDGSSHLDDTWEWDGTNWTLRSPANKPTARRNYALVYDSARGVTVLFGGYDGSSRLDDTWEWDGTDWSQRFPSNKPTMRSGHAMAYDSARGVAVLFGGHNNISRRNDTWEWDGANWTLRSPANKPTARTNYAMVYDSAREETVLFGGYDDFNVYLDDTWEWNGMDWILRSPARNPVARSGHAMAYDSQRGVTVLFGGSGYSDYLGDTWEYGLLLPVPTLAPIDNQDSDGDYLVTWGTVVGTLTYTLQEAGDPDFFSPVVRYEGSETHFHVTGQVGGTWYYRVRATSADVESEWSDSQAVVVLPWKAAYLYLPLVVRNH